MADIIYFAPRAAYDAQANLRDFIELCRTRLKPFGRDDIQFDSNIWRIAGLTAKGNALKYLYFTRQGCEVRGSKRKPGIVATEALLREPFLGFSKALIAYMHGIQPTKDVSQPLLALRYLEAALFELNGSVEPASIMPQALNYACSLMTQNLGHRAAYGRAVVLDQIYRFVVKRGLVTSPTYWTNPIRSPQHNRNRVGKQFDQARFKKLPDPAALEALARIFNSSTSSPTEVVAPPSVR
jgi:hypothetical protein